MYLQLHWYQFLVIKLFIVNTRALNPEIWSKVVVPGQLVYPVLSVGGRFQKPGKNQKWENLNTVHRLEQVLENKK